MTLESDWIIQTLVHRKVDIAKVFYFEEISSTNDWLMEHGKVGDVCIADQQSAGKGRRGRTWVSPKTENIYLSLIVGFDEIPPRYSFMALYVALGICDVLTRYGLEGHAIKWPNDILWDGQKLAGILLESKGRLNEVVVGIGMNVSMSKQLAESIDQPWCSLRDAFSAEGVATSIKRQDIILDLIENTHLAMQALQTDTRPDFDARWAQYSLLDGKQVLFEQSEQSIEGKVIGLDDHGRILLKDKVGTEHCFAMGEVKLRGYD